MILCILFQRSGEFFCGAVVVIGGTTTHKIMQLTSQVFMYREVREFPCKKLYRYMKKSI